MAALNLVRLEEAWPRGSLVARLAHPRNADEAQTVSGVSRSSNNIKKPPSPIASQSVATFVGMYARQRAPSLRPAAKESTWPSEDSHV